MSVISPERMPALLCPHRVAVVAALRAKPRLERPLVVVNLSAAVGENLMHELRTAGIPVLMGTRNALRAIRHLVDLRAKPAHGESCSRGRPSPERLDARG